MYFILLFGLVVLFHFFLFLFFVTWFVLFIFCVYFLVLFYNRLAMSVNWFPCDKNTRNMISCY